MKSCVKCGATDRYASGGCRPCNRARASAWEAANPGKAKAKDRAYYEANREKVKARQRAYYEANSGKGTALSAERRAAQLKAAPQRTTMGRWYKLTKGNRLDAS